MEELQQSHGNHCSGCSGIDVPKQEELCVICQDFPSDQALVLSCRHLFCTMCAVKLLYQGFQRCPVCRAPIDVDRVRPTNRRLSGYAQSRTTTKTAALVSKIIPFQDLCCVKMFGNWNQWKAIHTFTHSLYQDHVAVIAMPPSSANKMVDNMCTLERETYNLQRHHSQLADVVTSLGRKNSLDFRPGLAPTLNLPASVYLPAMKLYEHLDSVSRELLRVLSCHTPLEIERVSALLDMVPLEYDMACSSVLQLVKPIRPGPPEDQPGNCNGVVERGLLTLVASLQPAGLQVCNLKGDWMDVMLERGQIAILTGCSLQNMTHHHLQATEHRVDDHLLWQEGRMFVVFNLRPRAGAHGPSHNMSMASTVPEVLERQPLPPPPMEEYNAESLDSPSSSMAIEPWQPSTPQGSPQSPSAGSTVENPSQWQTSSSQDSESNDRLCIFVKTLTNTIYQVVLAPGSRLSQLVVAVCSLLEVRPQHMILIHGGQRIVDFGQLPLDDKPLDELGIHDAATVFSVGSF